MSSGYIQKLKEEYPFPWKTVVHPKGSVVLLDSTGKEISMFTMTDFVCFITNVMAAKPEKINEIDPKASE